MSSHIGFLEAFEVVQPFGQTFRSLQVSLGAVGQPIIAATELQLLHLRVQQLEGTVHWTLPGKDSQSSGGNTLLETRLCVCVCGQVVIFTVNLLAIYTITMVTVQTTATQQNITRRKNNFCLSHPKRDGTLQVEAGDGLNKWKPVIHNGNSFFVTQS